MGSGGARPFLEMNASSALSMGAVRPLCPTRVGFMEHCFSVCPLFSQKLHILVSSRALRFWRVFASSAIWVYLFLVISAASRIFGAFGIMCIRIYISGQNRAPSSERSNYEVIPRYFVLSQHTKLTG